MSYSSSSGSPRRRLVRAAAAFGLCLLALAVAPAAEGPKLPAAEPVGRLEVVATFDGPIPTGVTVSRKGRIFVNFPRWGDKVEFTVAELKGGKPSHMTIGADGVAIGHDGRHLYYCPLSSRRLYRVRTEALLDEKAGAKEADRAVEYLGDRGFASDGL